MLGKLEKLVQGAVGVAMDKLMSSDRLVDALAERLLEHEGFLKALKRKNGHDDFTVFSFRDVYKKRKVDGKEVYELDFQDPLAREICEGLGKTPGHLQLDKFADKTHLFTVGENVRKRDNYIIIDVDPEKDVDGEILRAMMLAGTLKSCHSGNVTGIFPNLDYSRQDQSYGKRQLITASFLARLYREAGFNHIITIGLHAPQIEGFHKSIDHIKTRPIFSHYITNVALNDMQQVVEFEVEFGTDGKKTYESDHAGKIQFLRERAVYISPDAGGMRGVTELRRDTDPEGLMDIGFIQKERIGINTVAAGGKVVGDVRGKVAILYDDIVDTGGSLFKAAKALKEAGALYVIACVDHALGNSKPGEKSFEEQLAESDIDELVVTNTKPEIYQRVMESPYLRQKTTVLSVGPILKEAILRDQSGDTIRDVVAQVGRENLYKILHKKGE
ncbi:MAG: ribose-phosphate pyrophosphokinase-like domain-containing protein [Candidatus Woesearchaeota archaeon]